MVRWLRRLVSTNKRRWQDGKHDLDLSMVVEDRILAMGYPSEGLRALARNPMAEVQSFLASRYGSQCLVVNLCIEEGWTYPGSCLAPAKVVHHPMWDAQGPPLASIHSFCEKATDWLLQHPGNCVVVHCKAGKGRTGTLVAALLLFLVRHAPHILPSEVVQLVSRVTGSDLLAATLVPSASACSLPVSDPEQQDREEGTFDIQEGLSLSEEGSRVLHKAQSDVEASFQQIEQAVAEVSDRRAAGQGCQINLTELVLPILSFWADKRTVDGTGLTISSQRRYVSYYAYLLQHQMTDVPVKPVHLLKVVVHGLCTRLPSSRACLGKASLSLSSLMSAPGLQSQATAGAVSSASRPGGAEPGLGGPDDGTNSTASSADSSSAWKVPPLTLALWLRPRGWHTPVLLAYACTRTDEVAPASPRSSTMSASPRDALSPRVSVDGSQRDGCAYQPPRQRAVSTGAASPSSEHKEAWPEALPGPSSQQTASIPAAPSAGAPLPTVNTTQRAPTSSSHKPRRSVALPFPLHLEPQTDGSLVLSLPSVQAVDIDRSGGGVARVKPGVLPGALIEGDLKVQVLSGTKVPASAAVFKGGGSLFYLWVHTTFLDEHESHVPNALRPLPATAAVEQQQQSLATASSPPAPQMAPTQQGLARAEQGLSGGAGEPAMPEPAPQAGDTPCTGAVLGQQMELMTLGSPKQQEQPAAAEYTRPDSSQPTDTSPPSITCSAPELPLTAQPEPCAVQPGAGGAAAEAASGAAGQADTVVGLQGAAAGSVPPLPVPPLSAFQAPRIVTIYKRELDKLDKGLRASDSPVYVQMWYRRT